MRYRTFLLIMAAAVAVGLGVGAAYAYFTSAGKGTGSASIGTMSAVTVATTTATPTAALRPGGTGDVTLEVTNHNGYAVTLVSVVGTGQAITADTSHPGCTTTGVTFTNRTGLSTNIPAGSTSTIDLTNAAAMNATSSAGCQGATFSIPVTITVHRG